jgi:hypothetical protein
MERKLSIADIILIAGTRIALGAGIGLLGVIGKKSAQEINPAAETSVKMRNHSAIYLEVSEHSSPSG